MGNDSIKITPEELRNIALEMETKISSAAEALNDATNSMNNTHEALQGGAADRLIDEYNSLKAKYNSFSEKLTDITDKLKKTADEYEKLDQELASSAEQLSSD